MGGGGSALHVVSITGGVNFQSFALIDDHLEDSFDNLHGCAVVDSKGKIAVDDIEVSDDIVVRISAETMVHLFIEIRKNFFSSSFV